VIDNSVKMDKDLVINAISGWLSRKQLIPKQNTEQNIDICV
jgi:hypothetical protein